MKNKMPPPASYAEGTLPNNSIDESFDDWWNKMMENGGNDHLPKDEDLLKLIKSITFSAWLTGMDLSMSLPPRAVIRFCNDWAQAIDSGKN